MDALRGHLRPMADRRNAQAVPGLRPYGSTTTVFPPSVTVKAFGSIPSTASE